MQEAAQVDRVNRHTCGGHAHGGHKHVSENVPRREQSLQGGEAGVGKSLDVKKRRPCVHIRQVGLQHFRNDRTRAVKSRRQP